MGLSKNISTLWAPRIPFRLFPWWYVASRGSFGTCSQTQDPAHSAQPSASMLGQLNSNFRVVKATVSLSALLSRVRLYNCVPNLVTPLVLKELVHQFSTRFVLSNVYFFSIWHVTKTRYPCFCQQKTSIWCKRCNLSSYGGLLTAPALLLKLQIELLHFWITNQRAGGAKIQYAL